MHVYMKLFNFEIQNCGQISCAHKPYFFMPGHILMKMMIHFLGAIVARQVQCIYVSGKQLLEASLGASYTYKVFCVGRSKGKSVLYIP